MIVNCKERLALPRAELWRRSVLSLRTGQSKHRLDKVHGSPTFRLVQVLSGHSCFEKYLCSMERKPTTECHHYGCCVDTAQHTLEVCLAWFSERRDFAAAVGDDLTRPALIKSMLESDREYEIIFL